MARHHMTVDGPVPFTPEEEAREDALQAELLKRNEEFARLQYQRNRLAEYPPVADYLDAVIKGDQSLMQAYIDACLAVKAKYPKPN